MAIHWQIKFKTLRAASLLTANIYDDTYSGSPLQLKGGAVPFETQEDDTDDMFTPIRTQSGYLRIVDDGTAMNSSNQSVAFNWRDFIPTTDTDRPVTLTDSNNNVLWQGFLQAQNFGAALYESPQERDFPLQCSLTVLECADINYDQKEIKNFAYLLQQIVGSIPATCRPSSFYVQGGADAQTWLMKCLDWQNFVNEDSDESTLEARFTMYEALEMMCRFWGWTARTMGTALYLTCADDSDEQTWLSLTAENLATMAGGTSAGTTSAAPSAVAIPGDIFGSVNNQDFQLRGPNKVDITANTNTADEYIIDPMDDQLVKDMKATAWQDGTRVDDVHYTEDILSIDRNFWSGTAMPDLASFNVEYKLVSDGQDAFHWQEIGPVIRIIQSYSNGIAFVSLVTKYEHLFADGFFRLEGEVYRQGDLYNSTSDGFFAGNGYMQMRLGIGKTRNTATWWDGQQWTNSITEFKATIGNRDEEIYTLYWPDQSVANAKETNIIAVGSTGLSGLLFVELLGSNSQVVTDISGQKCFDIKNFRVRFTKNNTVTKQGLSDSEPFPNSGYWMISEIDDLPKPVYKAQNNNNLRENLSESVDVGSERQMHLGWGIILNPANTYMSEIAYGGVNAHPEQHLADRIVNLWSTSKRRIDCELLTHDGSAATVAASLTPQNKVSIDGSTMYPVAISHNWRDDVTQIKMIELGPAEPPAPLPFGAYRYAAGGTEEVQSTAANSIAPLLTIDYEGTTQSDQEFTIRQTGSGLISGSGIATIEKIKGNTIAWNQLYNSEAPTALTGRTYYIREKVGSTVNESISTSISYTSGSTERICIDLSVLYGPVTLPSTVAAFKADYYKWFGKNLGNESYNAGVICNTQMTGMKTKDSGAFVLSNIALDMTIIEGKLNGTGDDIVIFPDGLNGVGSVHDEIDFENGVAYKRIGVVTITSSTSLDLLYINYLSQGCIIYLLPSSIHAKVNGAVVSLYYSIDRHDSISAQTNKTVRIPSTGSFKNQLSIKDSSILTNGMTKEQVRAALDGLTICYELLTPLEYTLSL